MGDEEGAQTDDGGKPAEAGASPGTTDVPRSPRLRAASGANAPPYEACVGVVHKLGERIGIGRQ